MGTKTIHATFDDETFGKLASVKEDRSWERAILEEFGVTEDSQ